MKTIKMCLGMAAAFTLLMPLSSTPGTILAIANSWLTTAVIVATIKDGH